MTKFYQTPPVNPIRISSVKNKKKSLLFLFGMLLLMSILSVKVAVGQIYVNSFTGTSACPTNGNTPVMATNSTGTALTRSTITCNATANVFNSSTLNATAAVVTTSYIQFSATANAGFRLDLTSLSFFRQGSNSAPNRIEVRYSLDGFATAGTVWGAEPLTPATGSVTTWDFADFSTTNGGTVTFRIYPYGTQRVDLTVPAAVGTGTFRLDDVTINGTVTALGGPPTVNATPATLFKFYGNSGFASSGQSFSVSGANLTTNLTVGPLAGYEFATTSTFVSPLASLSFAPSAGTVSSTTVFARLVSTNPVGSYNGNIAVASSGATTVNVAVTGEVYGNGTGNFTAGNILTVRVGETSGPALSSAAAPIFLDEYTIGGVFVQSKPLPFSTNALGVNNRSLTLSGSATSEGYLNLSPDGQYLTFAGYDAVVGTPAVVSVSAATANRIVARVTQNGTINTTTRISDGYDGNNIRSAATVDGNAFWTGGTGTGGGTRYMTLGNTGTTTLVSSTPANTRGTAIYNSQLFMSSQSGTNRGINTVGTGLPTTTGNTSAIISGLADDANSNMHGFVFVDVDGNGTPDVMYVADAGSTQGGLLKFSNSSGSWTARGRLPNPSGRAIYGVTATVISPGTDRRIFLNLGTGTSIATEIYSFVDNSAATANITSNGTDIITACGSPIITSSNPANVGFKGVTFVPVNVPTPTVDHTFTSPGPLTAAQGNAIAPLYRIQADITDGNALLTGVTVTTSGLYSGSDVTSFKLILSTDATLDVFDPVISTIVTSTGPGQTLAFTGLGQNLPVGTTRYIFVAAAVSGCANVGNTIGIASTPLANITYSNPATVKNGSPAAGSAYSIVTGTLDNPASFAASSGTPTVNLTWTNPSCVTEILIFANTSPIAGAAGPGPYTGENTNYTLATNYPGLGRLVYRGTTSPQSISGLTIGQTYHFKAFTRFGSQFSSGVTASATPQQVNIYVVGDGNINTAPILSLTPGGPGLLASDPGIGGFAADKGLVVLSGSDALIGTSNTLVREIIVNAGGTLKATSATNTYFTLFGDVTCNGVIGDGSTPNGISLNINGNSTTIQGNGTIDFNRIRKNTSTPAIGNLIFNANVNVRFTGNPSIHVETINSRLNVLVSAGKTVNVIGGDVSFNGNSGTAGSDRSGSLIVNGTLNITNGGTLFARNANVTGGTVSISTGSTGVLNLDNLNTDLALGTGTTVNFAAGSRVNISGALTVASGTLSSNGAIRLLSSASGTARIANSAGNISGNITAERFVPVKGWHLTGTALGGQAITDWNDDLATQGPMIGVETYNQGYFTSSIYTFDQNNNDPIEYFQGATTTGWVVPPGPGIIQNKGYRVFIPAGATLDNTGTYSTGTKTITLTSGGISSPGYNLVLNPHLSPILRTGFVTSGSVQNAIVIWDPSTETYRYEGTALGGWTIGGGGPSPIASGQGFFMFTPSSGSVDIPESAKSAASATFYRTSTTNSGVEVQLKNNQGKVDAALFQFLDDAQSGYDTEYDALKIMNPGLNVFLINNENKRLAVNGLPFEGDQTVMPLGFKAGQGVHTLSFHGLDNLNSASQVYLKDNETGTLQDLNENAVYSFVNASDEVNTDRFELIFTNSVTSVSSVIRSSVSVFPNPVASGKFTVATANLQGEVTIEILDMIGRKIDSKVINSSSSSLEIQLNTPQVSGRYSVKISDSKGTVVKPLMVK